MIGTQRTVTTCDVCRLLDGNLQAKPCTWCGTCRAWICDADIKNWPRRARAMAARAMGG